MNGECMPGLLHSEHGHYMPFDEAANWTYRRLRVPPHRPVRLGDSFAAWGIGRLTRGLAVNPDGWSVGRDPFRHLARLPSPACPARALHAGPATVLMDSTGQDANGISGNDRSLPRMRTHFGQGSLVHPAAQATSRDIAPPCDVSPRGESLGAPFMSLAGTCASTSGMPPQRGSMEPRPIRR